MTDALTLALDQLVDRLDDANGNWDDVLRRAQPRASVDDPMAKKTRASGQHKRSQRRLIVVGIVLLVALIALLATPAFGLRAALKDLIGGEPVHFGEAEDAPKVIKYQFEDLSLSAPPGMDPRVEFGQARKVGLLTYAGRKRAVWVAPARDGGFCYFLDRGYGGCLRTSSSFLPPLTTTITGGGGSPGSTPSITSIGGTVLSDETATVTIEFADGSSVDVPFIYVSTPIDAGFFAYDVPKEHQTANFPVAVVSRDQHGDEIWSEPIPPPQPNFDPIPPKRLPRNPLPAKAPVELTAPVRRAEANGGVVTVGHNGAAEFDLTHLDDSRVRLLKKVNLGYGCFALLMRDGKPYARGYNSSAPLRKHAGIPNRSVGPIDGCELQAGVGHLWPDRFGSHAAVEFALTDAARRYFEDRAAARDLALFVKGKTVKQIRTLQPPQAAAALKARYGSLISPLAKLTDKPPSGMIGYAAGDDSLVFVRMSTTGKRFEVVVRDGKIVGPRLRPWAMVF